MGSESAMSDGWNPGGKYKLYLQKIQEILGEERRTVRDVYYALEARGFPAECRNHGYEFEYRYVKRAVKKGRRHGYIDPHLIIDTSRQTDVEPRDSHKGPRDWLEDRVNYIKHGYFQDFWDDQPKHVEVWLEKAALVSVFRDICNEYNVRLEATRGDWSDSKVFEATQRLARYIQDGDDVKVLYFGDFNPSGLHAPVAIQNTMRHYGITLPWAERDIDSSNSDYFDIWPWFGDDPMTWNNTPGSLHFERISLTLDEIERFDLPENPTPSSTDKDRTLRDRFMSHASDGRDVNIELNALKEYHRDYLEDRLRENIEKHIDEDLREQTQDRVDSIHEDLQDAVDVDYSVVE